MSQPPVLPAGADAAGGQARLLVIAGPSGVGKGTIVRGILEALPTAVLSVSMTTRRPRPGEIDGVDYHFVRDHEFDRAIAAGDLLEWAHVHRHRSGTPRVWVLEQLQAGRVVVLEIDVKGALQVRQRAPTDRTLLVFLAPPSFDELVRRLDARGTEMGAERELRLRNAREEMEVAPAFDHVVVNDDVARCVAEVVELIGPPARVDGP